MFSLSKSIHLNLCLCIYIYIYFSFKGNVWIFLVFQRVGMQILKVMAYIVAQKHVWRELEQYMFVNGWYSKKGKYLKKNNNNTNEIYWRNHENTSKFCCDTYLFMYPISFRVRSMTEVPFFFLYPGNIFFFDNDIYFTIDLSLSHSIFNV